MENRAEEDVRSRFSDTIRSHLSHTGHTFTARGISGYMVGVMGGSTANPLNHLDDCMGGYTLCLPSLIV